MDYNEVIELFIKYGMKALKKQEVPVVALIFDNNNNFVSFGINNRQKKYDILGHAEVIAIRKAEKKIKDWRLNGYKMYVSLEPCEMCSAIIKESRLEEVYFLLNNMKCSEKKDVSRETFKQMNVNSFLVDKYKGIFSSFFDKLR